MPKITKCPKCKIGDLEPIGEDYSHETEKTLCNNEECKQQVWINYTRKYDLKTLDIVE